MEIRAKTGEIIIVDAGTGIRRLGNQLEEENRHTVHLIFTHAHWDHVMGFPFFRPIFNDAATIHMHRCPFHSKFVETILTKVMAPPNFPVRFENVTANVVYEEACPLRFQIGSVQVTPIALNHPNSGSGYKFSEDGRHFVFLTDNELGAEHKGGRARQEYSDFCMDADLLIHDAEYTPEEYRLTRGWGHSCYQDVVEMACEGGVRKLGLFHINQDRVDKEMDAIVNRSRRWIHQKKAAVQCFGVAMDQVFEL